MNMEQVKANMKDGKYLTHPLHGNSDRTRVVAVERNIVRVYGSKHCFTVEDFFKVNVLVQELE